MGSQLLLDTRVQEKSYPGLPLPSEKMQPAAVTNLLHSKVITSVFSFLNKDVKFELVGGKAEI